ncbi:unnamed protein product, partial [Timema podura]|nr:unnamed protein product [Timema podura]
QRSPSSPQPLSPEQVSPSSPQPLSPEQVSPSSLRPFSTGGLDDMPTCNPLGVFHSSSPGSSELNVDCASPGSLLGHGSASPLSAGDSDRPISRMAFCSERGPRHTSPEHFAQDFSQLCISAENCNNTITALVPFEAPPPKTNLGVSGIPVIALEWYTSSTDYPETFLKGSEADSFEEAAIGTDAIPSPGGDCGWGSTLAHRYQLDGDQCTVQSCLNQFTALELMTGSNKVGCENCSQRHNHGKEGKMVYTNSTKQLLVSWPPAVLILHLKRFQVFRSMFRKISCQVNFPLVLDIAPICSSKAAKDCPTIRPGQTQVLYSLYGVVEHSGGLHGGHYVAYVKVRAPITPDDPRWSFLPPNLNGRNSTVQLGQDDALPEPPAGRWFHVSDSRVNEVSEERVLKSPAYLLFYERIY